MDLEFPEFMKRRLCEQFFDLVLVLGIDGDPHRLYLHAHGIVLHALGRLGNSLLHRHRKDWKAKLKELSKIDWHRSSPIWEGRATLGGNVSKSGQLVTLTTNLIKSRLGVALTRQDMSINIPHKQMKTNADAHRDPAGKAHPAAPHVLSPSTRHSPLATAFLR